MQVLICFQVHPEAFQLSGGKEMLETVGILNAKADRHRAEVKAAAAGQEVDEDALSQQEAFITNMFDSQSSAFYTSGHLMDDGMIDPRETRQTLGFLLETVWETRHRAVRPNSFGIARM